MLRRMMPLVNLNGEKVREGKAEEAGEAGRGETRKKARRTERFPLRLAVMAGLHFPLVKQCVLSVLGPSSLRR